MQYYLVPFSMLTMSFGLFYTVSADHVCKAGSLSIHLYLHNQNGSGSSERVLDKLSFWEENIPRVSKLEETFPKTATWSPNCPHWRAVPPEQLCLILSSS